MGHYYSEQEENYMTESESSRRYREEMEAKYNSDSKEIKRQQERKRAKEAYEGKTPEEVAEVLKEQNKQVAKSTGLFGWLFGGADSSNESSDTYADTSTQEDRNRARLERADSMKPVSRQVVSVETGRCDNDGNICSVTYYSDGTEEWSRM